MVPNNSQLCIVINTQRALKLGHFSLTKMVDNTVTILILIGIGKEERKISKVIFRYLSRDIYKFV